MKKRIFKLIIIYISIIISTLLLILLLNIIKYKCPYKEFLHIHCAGCGTTRMIESLLNFEIYKAFRYNPLMFILGIIIGIYMIYISIQYVKGNNIKKPKAEVLISIGIIMVIFMILRNIPIFSFLAPLE